jgi:hypothetical protein
MDLDGALLKARAEFCCRNPMHEGQAIIPRAGGKLLAPVTSWIKGLTTSCLAQGTVWIILTVFSCVNTRWRRAVARVHVEAAGGNDNKPYRANGKSTCEPSTEAIRKARLISCFRICGSKQDAVRIPITEI